MLGPLMPDSTATSATSLAHLGWLIRLAVYAIAGVLIAAAWRWAGRVGRIEATRAEARRVLDAASAEPTSQAACQRLLDQLGRWRSSLVAALYVGQSPDRVELLASWTAPGVELPGSWRDGGDAVGTTLDARGLPRRRQLAPATAIALAATAAAARPPCRSCSTARRSGSFASRATTTWSRSTTTHSMDCFIDCPGRGGARSPGSARRTVGHPPGDRAGPRRSDRPDVLRPVFQPILSIGGGGVAGYEALARLDVEPSEPPDRWFARAAEAGSAAELQALAIRRARDVAARRPTCRRAASSPSTSARGCSDPTLSGPRLPDRPFCQDRVRQPSDGNR